jgi:signal transduction histidine kinase
MDEKDNFDQIIHGLGLYTAKSLVKQTGGKLKVLSKINVGTHVEFSTMCIRKRMEMGA